MTDIRPLTKKQSVFTRLQAEFQLWCFNQGYHIIEAESFRTKEQAEWYAARGKGIKNSVHTKKLARDIFILSDPDRGKISWDREDYRPLGEKWKSLHVLNRWGGDFRNRDVVHFSMWHQGVA